MSESKNKIIEDEGGGVPNSNNGLLKGKNIAEVKFYSNGSAVPLGNEHLDSIVDSLLNERKPLNLISADNIKSIVATSESPIKKYTCIKCFSYYCHQSESCNGASQCFIYRHKPASGEESFSRGCIGTEEQATFVCSSSFRTEEEAMSINCCQGDFCNDGDYPTFSSLSGGTSISRETAAYMVLSIFLLVAAVIFTVYMLMTKNRYCRNHRDKYLKRIIPGSSSVPPNNGYRSSRNHKLEPYDESTQRMLNDSLSSGSGSGLPLFVQRTLAKNIRLEQMIGKGRYGEVWKGIWQGEPVAVKVFFTRDEGSWQRETEVYSTVLLRHENILGFYGSDKTCVASCAQLWLVTHYHPNGSLHNFLRTCALSYQDLFTLCLSLVNGILHLHTEIMGTQGKPAIAHRDINSNNVLVKNDGSCCISDLGLAVIQTPGTGEINVGNIDRSGTIRYMSPEILNGRIDMETFDSFRKADIYSLALVLWEMSRRCVCQGIAEDYSRPFGNILPDEPSYDEMHDVVCARGLRPQIPNRWAGDEVLTGMDGILKECWHENPHVRLSALRIKKSLIKLFDIDYSLRGKNN